MSALWFSEDEFMHLAKPFEFALVGKFPLKRPVLDAIRRFFFNLKLTGDFSITLLDQSNVLIKLSNDLDYGRIFAHRSYFVYGCFIKIIKWSPTLDLSKESPVVPVWISFPGLRPHLFSSRILFGLGSVFGRPIQTDNATAVGSRPSVARILVELDISKNYHDSVWLGPEKLGYVQKVVLEGLPNFCPHCKVVGHKKSECPKLIPNQRPVEPSALSQLKSVPISLSIPIFTVNSSIPNASLCVDDIDNNVVIPENDVVIPPAGELNSDSDINVVNGDISPSVQAPVSFSKPILLEISGGMGDKVLAEVGSPKLLVSDDLVQSSPDAIILNNLALHKDCSVENNLGNNSICSNNLVDVYVNLVDTHNLFQRVGINPGSDFSNQGDWLHGSSEFESDSEFSDCNLADPDFFGGSDPGNDFTLVRDRPVASRGRGRFRGRGRGRGRRRR
ncbi:hypothetical protein MA16_Dca004083 [Dendrobium catenatum]|uniref:DUF4283 domain-containing protein n=1 Tax=Dendrobium catenatum TaxID=906689 RepID=A0A2I0X2D6_9ASPA|nr:hypothetical protein MA16_Dca004083 [Dendrobium catenatum]